MSRERELRHHLARHLEDLGALRSPAWRRCFEVVPRHRLIPRFRPYVQGRLLEEIDATRPDSEAAWIEYAYRDLPAITRVDERGYFTSSSSMPSLMARMLKLLEVRDGDTVLEIGTGTGYNAALLCERLGSEQVTSIDIQADLVEEARGRLAELGYHPHLAIADGVGGYPERAPYDRIICTGMAWPIPTAWLEQVRPGGRIVSVVPEGCVALERREDETASGHYDRESYRFMPIQPWPGTDSERIATAFAQATADRESAYPLSVLDAGGSAERSFQVLVRALVSPAPKVFEHAGDRYLWSLEDDSWARFPAGSRIVQQAGPRRLWDLVESLFERWCRLGAPNRERFGLTVTPAGEHTLWLDRPDSEHRWAVPDVLLERGSDH
ncbi:MAG TPA: methyltransferase domain-containing protein [Candidatus Dormibacteraeota bacterium]|nr:methyltransferase domain-containing protein [Candidatus Dormibacteraeota bacterium]